MNFVHLFFEFKARNVISSKQYYRIATVVELASQIVAARRSGARHGARGVRPRPPPRNMCRATSQSGDINSDKTFSRTHSEIWREISHGDVINLAWNRNNNNNNKRDTGKECGVIAGRRLAAGGGERLFNQILYIVCGSSTINTNRNPTELPALQLNHEALSAPYRCV